MAALCRAIWWSSSAATTSRERRRRSRCSRRRWINGERSPTTTAGSRRSAPGCPRRRSTASRRSTTTCSSRAGERHVRVCTGTACFAATGDAHVERGRAGASASSSASAPRTGRVSLAETVCLGYCHARPAVRDGDVDRRRAGRGRARCSPTRPQPAPEPDFDEPARRAGADPPRRLVRATRSAHAHARGAARGGQGRRRPRPRRRRLPRRHEVGVRRASANGEQKFIVANGDEGDPGSYIDKLLMEDNPHLLLEGHGARGLRGRRRARLHPRALRVPALQARARRRRSHEAREHGHLGERFDVTVVEGAGSYVVGEETALLACLAGPARHRLRAAAVPGRARRPRPADGRQQRRDALQHPVHRAPRRRGLPRAQPGRDARHRSSSASTSASPGPASTRCRSG